MKRKRQHGIGAHSRARKASLGTASQCTGLIRTPVPGMDCNAEHRIAEPAEQRIAPNSKGPQDNGSQRQQSRATLSTAAQRQHSRVGWEA